LLAVLAASVGFELDTGDKDEDGRNDSTIRITRFAKWLNQMDENKECYKSAMVILELANTLLRGNVVLTCMIRLCNTPITCSRMRATTDDPVWAFLAGPGRDLAKLVLSFKLGVKVGKGDLREASKEKLLEVGFELKVLRMENNGYCNAIHWGVIVDGVGKVVEGGIR